MSWYAIAWAETAPVADVYERAVLTFLAHRSRHSDGSGAYPSIATISKFAMCDERSVKRRLDALRERGLIALGDQALAKGIEPRYRPPVYDLLIPFRWFSESQRGDVNRERAERGQPPLSEVERPVILPAEKSRKPRSDRGLPRSNKLAAGSPGDVPGLLDTPDPGTTGDPGVTNSVAQGGLVVPTRGVYETPKEVVKDLSLKQEQSESAHPTVGPFDNPPDFDPFTADISAARRKSARKRRVPSVMSETARSHRAERLTAGYESTLPRKLPHAERLALARGIDECLDLGWTEADITDRALPHWNASGKGAALFTRIASEAVARNPASKPSSTSERFNQHRVDHQNLFDPETGFFRDDLDRLIVESEVVDIRQLEA